MSKDIIMVTGMPRSGTSWMMQTLKLMGVPIHGEKFPFSEAKTEHQKKIKSKNPRGYFESQGIVNRGIPKDRLNEFHGKAVKIMLHGLIPWGSGEYKPGVDPANLKLVFLCVRNPYKMFFSRHSMRKNHEMDLRQKFEDYKTRLRMIYQWLDMYQSNQNIIIVDYDLCLEDPESFIKRIAPLFNISPRSKLLDACIRNTDKGMDTTIVDCETIPELDFMYELLRTHDFKTLEYLLFEGVA